MNRDEALVAIAVHSNHAARWVHETRRDWSQQFLSPDVLETMPMSEVERRLARLVRSSEDTATLARQVFPGADGLELAAVVRENQADTMVALCAQCWQPIEAGPGYLVWDGQRHKWLRYCAQDHPAEYWREWPSGKVHPDGNGQL